LTVGELTRGIFERNLSERKVEMTNGVIGEWFWLEILFTRKGKIKIFIFDSFILFRVSICDRVVFNVAGIGNGCWCCWIIDGTPRRDWAVGRDVWWLLFGVDGILSLMFRREFVEGFGLYKHDRSISFPNYAYEGFDEEKNFSSYLTIYQQTFQLLLLH